MSPKLETPEALVARLMRAHRTMRVPEWMATAIRTRDEQIREMLLAEAKRQGDISDAAPVVGDYAVIEALRAFADRLKP